MVKSQGGIDGGIPIRLLGRLYSSTGLPTEFMISVCVPSSASAGRSLTRLAQAFFIFNQKGEVQNSSNSPRAEGRLT